MAHRAKAYYQVGAPSLVYCDEVDPDTDAFSAIPPHRYPRVRSDEVQELTQRDHRLKARWNFSMDLDQVSHVNVPRKLEPGSPQRLRKQPKAKKKNEDMEMDQLFQYQSDYRRKRDDPRLQTARLIMLKETYGTIRSTPHRRLLESYSSYDYPYVPGQPIGAYQKQNTSKAGTVRSRLPWTRFDETRKFSLERQHSADPVYLAPFLSGALDACEDPSAFQLTGYDRTNLDGPPLRPTQGNCLLSLPCPCPVCHQQGIVDKSWVLFHPTGKCMDTLCISNLVLPGGVQNAGHIMVEAVAAPRNGRSVGEFPTAQTNFPSAIYLDDTILEVKQGGIWDSSNLDCTFFVRTGTHVSVLVVTVAWGTKQKADSRYQKDGICWGNYLVEERQRIDLRSLSRFTLSYSPVSLAAHPRYGNKCVCARYAFVCHALQHDERNLVLEGVASETASAPNRHSISNLKSISYIDFTKTNPMCLWSAATSYVQPTLVPTYANKDPLLGFGSSLYTLDLRSDDATFQWSPSATRMTTEGMHSISGIMTNWEEEFTVWVTSRSAGVTWEIDGRMPCQVVQQWSLTAACEDSDFSIPQKGIYGEPAILTKTIELRDTNWVRTAPVANIDTTPGAFGFHLYQRPENLPRFQTESMESLSVPRLVFDTKSSIAASAVFPLPEVAPELYPCGLSAMRIPVSSLSPMRDDKDVVEDVSTALCVIVQINNGDLYVYTLLEATKELENCLARSSQPVGSAWLAVPDNMDGRTKESELKRQKLSGGMNLEMFVTNHAPLSRSVSTSRYLVESSNSRAIRFRTRRSAAKGKRQQQSVQEEFVEADNFKFKYGGNKVSLEAPQGSNLLSRGADLEIPMSLIEKARIPLDFQSFGDAMPKQDPAESQKKSDLSPRQLENLARRWDEDDDSEINT